MSAALQASPPSVPGGPGRHPRAALLSAGPRVGRLPACLSCRLPGCLDGWLPGCLGDATAFQSRFVLCRAADSNHCIQICNGRLRVMPGGRAVPGVVQARGPVLLRLKLQIVERSALQAQGYVCLSLSLSIYIYIYIHIHIYIYIHICICICICIYIYIYMNIYIYIYTHTYTHIHIHVYIYIYIYMYCLRKAGWARGRCRRTEERGGWSCTAADGVREVGGTCERRKGGYWHRALSLLMGSARELSGHLGLRLL